MLHNELLDAMDAFRLSGMRAVFDEMLATSLKQRHTPERLILDLLRAEQAERSTRSIRYHLGLANFPVEKDLDSFDFKTSPIHDPQIRSLYEGSFLSTRNTSFLLKALVQEKLICRSHLTSSCTTRQAREVL